MSVSPSTATITIKDATTGQSVYTGTIGVNTGNRRSPGRPGQ
ncbi:MAG: hypothetical protein WCD30_01850 [Pseudolabrys sp.]